MYILLKQFQVQYLKEEAKRKTEEKKTLQKVLEGNDVEMKRLAQLVKDQESQLRQKPDPRTMDEHQLQRYLDILCDIMDSKKKLLDVEDERHITATEVKILQEEALCSQKHATTLVSGCTKMVLLLHTYTFPPPVPSLQFPLFLHPTLSCSHFVPLLPSCPPLSSSSDHFLSETK